MASFYTQKGSPYYWVRVYDRLSEEEEKRRSFSSKIKISTTDMKRLEKGLRPQGTAEIHRLLQRIDKGFADLLIAAKLGLGKEDPGPPPLMLSDALRCFIEGNTLPGTGLRPKTIEAYKNAVKHMKAACGDKPLAKYTKDDNAVLLKYLSNLEGKDGGKFSQNSMSIITRTLRSLWGYFIKQEWVTKHVIEKVASFDKEPEPIPAADMYKILTWLKVQNLPGYYLTKFMLLTATRPSSALVMMKENINFKKFYLHIANVKAGHRKKDIKQYYTFPLYEELHRLLADEMGITQGSKGRLFPWYGYSDLSYTQSLRFWQRCIMNLYTVGEISEHYQIKQLRPTLPNYLINKMGVDIFTVQKLLDHSNIKVTQKSYIKFETERICDKLDELELNKWLMGYED